MTCNCPTGFTGSADVSAISVLSSHECETNFGIQLTALMHNLSSATAVSGTVSFYWVPLGWTGSTAPVPTPDFETGSNQAQAMNPDGTVDVAEGRSAPATLCWVPNSQQIGAGAAIKGNILAVAATNGPTPCNSPSFSCPPCTQLSGTLTIFDSSTAIVPPGFRNPHHRAIEGLDPRTGEPATFVSVGFVIPNTTGSLKKVRAAARAVGIGGRPPPVGSIRKEDEAELRIVSGASRLADVGVRVGLGKVRRNLRTEGFMADFHTGVVGFPTFRRLLDGDHLQVEKEFALEPGDIQQGLLEVAFPQAGAPLKHCLLDVAYLSAETKKRIGGFLLAVTSDGATL